MSRRGFSEKTFHGVNPLPNTPDVEVLKKAKLEMFEGKNMKPFTIDWAHAPGVDYEFIRLEPGDHVILRESEVPGFMSLLGDLGATTYSTEATPLEKAEAELKGMRRAMEHFGRQGNPRLIAVRKTHGLTAEEMEDYRYEHWAYYYNQARSDILKDAVQAKQKEIAKLKKDAEKEAAVVVDPDSDELPETNHTE